MRTFKTHDVTPAEVTKFKAALPDVEKAVAAFTRRAKAILSLDETKALVEELEAALRPLKEFQTKCLPLTPLPSGSDPEPLPPGAMALFQRTHELENELVGAWHDALNRPLPRRR